MRNKKLLSVILATSMIFSMNSFAWASEVVEVDEFDSTYVEEVGGAEAGEAGRKGPEDGIADAIWGGQELFPLGQVILGTVRDGRDLSAGFRTLWDEENLYMLVEVEDDEKLPASVIFPCRRRLEKPTTRRYAPPACREVHASLRDGREPCT